jgi:hypothetical protein
MERPGIVKIIIDPDLSSLKTYGSKSGSGTLIDTVPAT